MIRKKKQINKTRPIKKLTMSKKAKVKTSAPKRPQRQTLTRSMTKAPQKKALQGNNKVGIHKNMVRAAQQAARKINRRAGKPTAKPAATMPLVPVAVPKQQQQVMPSLTPAPQLDNSMMMSHLF